MNRLGSEKSAYLQHAAKQNINWYPWCEEAFKQAKKEDKPVFLSTGAIWCHWCHVMARECFEDEEIGRLLNNHFITIKLDRDERPDIDRLYQQAVAMMGVGGGWPLSVFLTPEKKPFFGGTYFPPEDRLGRPGFKKVILSVSEFYKSKKDEISEYTTKLLTSLQPESLTPGEINEALIENAVSNIISDFDPQYGGFGSAPKFPMPGALEFLMNRYILTGEQSAGHAVKITLESMARGGIHDQLGGGFHRYSTDESWIIPHFEKMSDDNAWLLRNYVLAYTVFEENEFKEVAQGIIQFVRDVLSAPDGGFYASQDADVTPEDEGGYFTWTDEDLKKVLTGDEYRVLSHHLFHKRGAMHHDESKRVLFRALETRVIADELGMESNLVSKMIKKGKEKLLRERRKRETPFIDKTIYTSLNGMLITSFLIAYRILRDDGIKDVALKSLDRIMGMYFDGRELYHSEGIKGMLEDYIHIIEAHIAAYEVTGRKPFLQKADELMEHCINNFWDNEEGGFFNSDNPVLDIKMKGIEDISHPSANSLGIMLLQKLSYQLSKDTYSRYAEKSLKAFALRVKGQGILSGYYFASLDAYLNMLLLAIHSTGSDVREKALTFLSPYVTVNHGEDKGCVIPCRQGVCYDPLDTPEKLGEFFRKKKYLNKQ
ncbi:MAG: thioredoxin domain-containing protein [Nitrospiraceae bacterium]|nr:MAG: thioredoxin domain-containing protein [Nitrospiraceae bacterium]